MTDRLVDSYRALNANIRTKIGTQSLDKNIVGSGTVPNAASTYVSVAEYGDGVFHQSVFTVTALPITMRDTEQGGGFQIYDFPLGRITTLGGTATIAVTTTSELSSTLNTGVTCNYGVGTVTQTNTTVATTEQDLVNVTAFTASATINVAGADATGVGVGILASLDGSSTARDAFLNLAVDGATDIDADATVTVTGTVTLTWINVTNS
jgi:hypothetical protein